MTTQTTHRELPALTQEQVQQMYMELVGKSVQNPVEQVAQALQNLPTGYFKSRQLQTQNRRQQQNLMAVRETFKLQTETINAFKASITAKSQATRELFDSGLLSPEQLKILAIKYPYIAAQFQRDEELKGLRAEREAAEHTYHITNFKEKTKELTQDPAEKYRKNLTRQIEESLAGMQLGMQAAIDTVVQARAFRQQIDHGNFSDEERAFLHDRLTNSLAEQYVTLRTGEAK